jgi:hypothetical protein
MKFNYQALFYLMASYQYSYVDGSIKGVAAADNRISFDFSTGYNGRGNAVTVYIDDGTCDFEVFMHGKKPVRVYAVPFKKFIATLRKSITQ